MKRLRDERGPAGELLARIQPLADVSDMKQRVRARLHGRRRARVGLLKPAIAAALLIGGAAMAHSLITTWWPVHRDQPEVPPAPRPAAVHRAVAPAVETPAPPPPVAAPAPPPAPVKHHVAHRAQPIAAAAPSDEESQLMLEAVQALRRDHDAARAQELIDHYLAKYPGGALEEEALGLSIEAAAGRGDARAAELAARYLEKYPNGRFKAAAERARERFAP